MTVESPSEMWVRDTLYGTNTISAGYGGVQNRLIINGKDQITLPAGNRPEYTLEWKPNTVTGPDGKKGASGERLLRSSNTGGKSAKYVWDVEDITETEDNADGSCPYKTIWDLPEPNENGHYVFNDGCANQEPNHMLKGQVCNLVGSWGWSCSYDYCFLDDSFTDPDGLGRIYNHGIFRKGYRCKYD